MKIEVLGSGCPTCQSLDQLVREIVTEEKIEAEVVYLSGQEGINRIIELGLTGSPALVINSQPVFIGLPDKETLRKIIKQFVGKDEENN